MILRLASDHTAHMNKLITRGGLVAKSLHYTRCLSSITSDENQYAIIKFIQLLKVRFVYVFEDLK